MCASRHNWSLVTGAWSLVTDKHNVSFGLGFKTGLGLGLGLGSIRVKHSSSAQYHHWGWGVELGHHAT